MVHYRDFDIDDEYRGIADHPGRCLLCDTIDRELVDGERVVLTGHGALQDGSPVQVKSLTVARG